MLFKTAIVLFVAWLLGVVGVYRVGDLVHLLLLVGRRHLDVQQVLALAESGRRRTTLRGLTQFAISHVLRWL